MLRLVCALLVSGVLTPSLAWSSGQKTKTEPELGPQERFEERTDEQPDEAGNGPEMIITVGVSDFSMSFSYNPKISDSRGSAFDWLSAQYDMSFRSRSEGLLGIQDHDTQSDIATQIDSTTSPSGGILGMIPLEGTEVGLFVSLDIVRSFGDPSGDSFTVQNSQIRAQGIGQRVSGTPEAVTNGGEFEVVVEAPQITLALYELLIDSVVQERVGTALARAPLRMAIHQYSPPSLRARIISDGSTTRMVFDDSEQRIRIVISPNQQGFGEET